MRNSRWKGSESLSGLLAAVLSIAAASAPSAENSLPPNDSPVPEPASRSEEILLVARINGVGTGIAGNLLRLADGRLLASAETFRAWRMRLPAAAPAVHDGDDYYSLDAVPGLGYRVDESTQEIDLRGGPEMFATTSIGEASPPVVTPPPALGGGFANYDVQFQQTPAASHLSGLVELGLFNRLGVGTATFLGQSAGEPEEIVRLETAWTRDDPARLASFRLGDGVNRAGSWGRAVRFGGVQWGTQFATQPGFIPYPMPTLAGEAALPSTLDVYVNNVLRLRRDIPSGPFEIPSLPVVTGQGEAQLVVKDLLGRERVISQPYYVSPDLLRRGLEDFSYEAGFVREDYGLRSASYGRFLASLTHRRGLTDRFTGELRAEILSDRQTAGASGLWLFPPLGVASAALAYSHGPDGGGRLFSLGLQRQAQRWSFALQSQFIGDRFVQLGLPESGSAPRLTHLARISFSPTGGDSLSLSYLRQDSRGGARTEVVSANYNIGVARSVFLSLFAIDAGEDRTVGLTLTVPFGSRSSASLNYTQGADGGTATLMAQQNLPEGSGFGYRALTQIGATERTEAGVSWQTGIGTYTADASLFRGETGYRLGAAGGVAVLGGEAMPSRRITDSFAVVKVGEYPGVRVYAENQPVGRTDSRGIALIPRLRAYQNNTVGIEQADLPIDVEVDTLRLQLTPYRRSGVLASFPVRASRGALIRLVLESRDPVPAGAVVRIAGGAEEFPVARRGEAFVTGLAPHNELVVTWKGRRCAIRVDIPPDAGPLPELGPFTCEGVSP